MMIGWLIGEFWPLIAGAVGILAAFLAGRSGGARKAENKALKAQNEAMQKAKETREDVENMDPADRRSELDKWMRDRADD